MEARVVNGKTVLIQGNAFSKRWERLYAQEVLQELLNWRYTKGSLHLLFAQENVVKTGGEKRAGMKRLV